MKTQSAPMFVNASLDRIPILLRLWSRGRRTFGIVADFVREGNTVRRVSERKYQEFGINVGGRPFKITIGILNVTPQGLLIHQRLKE